MKAIEKWADRVYAENDFGRGIATSLSGSIGLVVYIVTDDWVIAAFSTIIAFPIIRIISTGINEKVKRKKQRNINKENAHHIYEGLSDEEKEVIKSYVSAGGSVLTWGQMNNQSVSFAAIESLIQREILWTSMTADGMRETFALDSSIFDIANEKYTESKSS
jgi:ABC-type multidrug transport system fused ATPase/permease subunit